MSLLHIAITAWAARGILLLSIAAGLAIFFSGRREKVSLRPIPFGRKGVAAFGGFLGFAALIYLLLWLAAIIMPDLSWDGNAYHIPTMAMWDVKGYVHWVQTPYLEGIINGYPKGLELVSYVTVKAFGNSIINATNLLFLPLGVLGIASMASLLGVGPWLALSAGAAFILVPVNINQAVTTYVDTAFASAVIALLGMAAYVSISKKMELKAVAAFGAALGLSLSVKSTGIALGGLILAAVTGIWIFDIIKHPPNLPGDRLSKKLGRRILSLIFPLLIILITALVNGGYWYLRNFIITGSPLYPVGLTLLGRTIFPGTTVSEAISGQPNTLEQLRGLPSFLQIGYTWAQGLQAWPLSLKGYDSRPAGLGFLWLLGCIPAIIAMLFALKRVSFKQRRIFLLLLGVTSVTFLLTPLNWWARYTVWIYGLGLPVLAFIVTDLVAQARSDIGKRRLAVSWLSLCIGLLLFEAAYCMTDVIALASPGSLRSHLSTLLIPGSWDWPANYLFPEENDTPLQTVLEDRANTALGPHGEMDFWHYAGLVGELSQPIGARRISFLSEEPGPAELASLGNTGYILWDRSVPLPESLKSLATSISPTNEFLVLTLR